MKVNGTGRRTPPSQPSDCDGIEASHIVQLCIFPVGLFCNLLALVVICRLKKKSSTSVYLAALAIFDLLMLVGRLMTALPKLDPDGSHLPTVYKYKGYFFIIGGPLGGFCKVGSVWTVILLTIERYLVICYPLKMIGKCTVSSALRRVTAIFLVSVIWIIPRCFQSTVLLKRDQCAMSSTDPENYQRVLTDFGKTISYRLVYVGIVQLTIVYIIPLLLLIVLNIRMIMQAKRAAKTTDVGSQFSKAFPTRTIMALVAVFIICYTPDVIVQIMLVIHGSPRNFPTFLLAAGTFLTINSSINFFLYFVSGRKFRKEVKRLLSCFCTPKSDTGTKEEQMQTISSHLAASTNTID